MPALRPGSLLSRIVNGKSEQVQGVPPIETWPYRAPPGMPALFKPQQSLRAYGDNVYLYRAVLSIAMEIGSTDFKLRKMLKSGEYEYIPSHQALETMRLPQPTDSGKTMLTGMLLKIITGMHLMLNGEAFWLLQKRLKVNGAPTFIMPLLSQYMHVNIDETGEVLQYTYRLGAREYRLDPMSVVHFRLPDPENIYRGHSPVQGIRYSIDTHKEADIMNFKRLQHNAVPSGIITTKGAVGEKQIEVIKSQWKQMYGGADNSGKTAVVPDGMDFKTVQQSNQEMQFTEGKSMSRDEILTAYGIGPEIMGKTESQTRANADTSVFVFERFGVSPFLKLINDTLTNDYLVTFPRDEGTEFCFDDPVPENMEDKRANADSLFNGGALTPNERRKMFGMEPLDLPGMDTTYMDMGKRPVDEEPLEGENTPADEL